jgi:hypothetical protein
MTSNNTLCSIPTGNQLTRSITQKRQPQISIHDSSQNTHDNPLNSTEPDTYPLRSCCLSGCDR